MNLLYLHFSSLRIAPNISLNFITLLAFIFLMHLLMSLTKPQGLFGKPTIEALPLATSQLPPFDTLLNGYI